MHRNKIHDIKPSSELSRRSAKKIPTRRPMRREIIEEDFQPEEFESLRNYQKGKSGRGLWYVAGLCILFLVFSLSFVFSNASIEITPKNGTFPVNKTITATKDGNDGLSFEMVVLEGEETAEITASDKTYVERKATGQVRIFNDHGSNEQKLLIDTRLETEDGKIYKTKVATTVPGQKTVNGDSTPGFVDVEIYADQPGETYNIEEGTTLKIIGFRGTPKYDTFYAETITAIEGGIKGEVYDVSEETKQSQIENLKKEVKADLVGNIRNELPEGFVLYDGATITVFDSIETDEGENSVSFKQKASVYAFVFKKEELEKEMVKNSVPDEGSIRITNIEDLNIGLVDDGNIQPETVREITIKIEDNLNVVWDIPEEEIIEAISGIKERDFEKTMDGFGDSVEKANLDLRPIWRSNLPDKPNQIKIINTFGA